MKSTDAPTVPRPPGAYTPEQARRVRAGVVTAVIGFVVFLVGARPSALGLDRSPIIGFIQIVVFLVGLAIMCLGGYIAIMALWKNRPVSIAVEFGARLISTGLLIAIFSGLADVFGFGSHPLPGLPLFGEWQARGVVIGQLIIAAGFLLLLPRRSHKP